MGLWWFPALLEPEELPLRHLDTDSPRRVFLHIQCPFITGPVARRTRSFFCKLDTFWKYGGHDGGEETVC